MREEEFEKQLEEIGIHLTALQKSQLEIYCNFLIEYNEHTNLTAIKEKNAIYLKHFYDSLLACKHFDFHQVGSLLDIGTGAGFPGMILKIVFPDLKVTLLDSNHKKTDFLTALSKKLELQDVLIVNERAEEFALKHIEEYDLVTSRAVAKLRILAELSIPILKIGGHFLALKGNCDDELQKALDTIDILGGKLNEKIVDTLPMEESVRTFIDIIKRNTTPKGYPRKYDKIVRNPLKKR